MTSKSAIGLVPTHFGSLTGATVGAKYGSRIGGLAGAATGPDIGFYLENTYVRGIRFADSYFTELSNYQGSKLLKVCLSILKKTFIK